MARGAPAGLGKLFGRSAEKAEGPEPETVSPDAAEATNTANKVTTEGSVLSTPSNGDSEHVQRGVKQSEAVTAAWSTKTKILAYAGIFLVFYLSSFQQQTTSQLTQYVTSTFGEHPLLATVSVLSSIIGAVAKLPIAKIIDIWGRAEGYVLMVVLWIMGLIMMAACQNVQTYAAAQVFFWVGYNGVNYVLDVFIADTSSLKNRAWLFAFSTCPFIANTFAGPAAAARYLDGPGWRWAFGSWCIIVPVISAPVGIIFFYARSKAERMGYISKESSGRSVSQSLLHYCIEFDLVGIILIVAAFALFLLPFSLASSSTSKWQSADIIAMIVIGGCLFPVFALWEKYFAPVSFAPFHLLVDRMVLSACIMAAALFISFYCWDIYFLSYLQVVHDQTVANAGYIGGIYNIGSCFWAVIIGFFIRATGKFKYVALAAVPLQILGVGLMIYFREPGKGIGYVIMCQIFIAFSGGTLTICQEMAVMAAASHAEVAVVLALLNMFSSIGGAIGQTISAAIWTNTIPGYLALYLPEDSKDLATTLYASITEQLKYPMGDPVRMAVIDAYGVAQRRMLIAGVAVLIIPFICILFWRDLNLKKIIQVKGNVV